MKFYLEHWVCSLCDAIVSSAGNTKPTRVESIPQPPEINCPYCSAPNLMFKLITFSYSNALQDSLPPPPHRETSIDKIRRCACA
jgi:DNA-directed RNA polymerase subunit RPC12/RpoP